MHLAEKLPRIAYGKGGNTMNKRTFGSVSYGILSTVFLILLCLVMLYPMLYVLFASLSDGNLIMSHSGLLLRPLGFNLSAYKIVLADQRVFTGYMNTIIVMVAGLLVNMVLTCLGAYFLTRKNVYFQKHIMILIVVTMFINGGLIPTYLVVKSLGLLDSRLALILPVAVNTYNLIIMKAGFASVPVSLEEAAKIDGASDGWVLIRVMIPLAMPTISVLILYYAVYHWNAWFNAMIYISNRSLQPLQVVLREILLKNQNQDNLNTALMQNTEAVSESIKYATIMVSIIPALCIYPFLQKYFTKGVMIGAVKG